MIDFNINRGPSTVLFSEPGIVNPRLIIEEGCWYLCTDTAELFLGIQAEAGLTLKRINEFDASNPDYVNVIETLSSEINSIKDNYAKKSDIAGFVTEQDVITVIEQHEALATVTEVKTKLDKEIIPTVQETILPAVQKVETEVLPTIQELAEKAATQEWVQKQTFATEGFVSEKISKIDIPSKVSELTNDTGFITLADVPEVDLSNTANKVHFHDEYALKEHQHDDLYEAKGAAEAVKNELLNGAGEAFDSLKELGDLINTNKNALNTLESIAANKADKEHSHSDYALKSSLENFAAKTDIPTSTSQLTNDNGYITENELDSKGFITDISDKADKVLFTSDKFVTNPIGSFAKNENIKGLSMAELFAKLLGLKDIPEETPDSPLEILVAEIKQNSIPVLQGGIKSDGSVVVEDNKSIYDYFEFTIDTQKSAPAEMTEGTSAFYEVKDTSNEVIEHGYQIYTIASGRGTFWRVAIAEGLTIKEVRMYDVGQAQWVAYSPTFIATDEKVTIDSYTYVIYQSSDRANKEVLRLIVE
jgi:hypothetical protein